MKRAPCTHSHGEKERPQLQGEIAQTVRAAAALLEWGQVAFMEWDGLALARVSRYVNTFDGIHHTHSLHFNFTNREKAKWLKEHTGQTRWWAGTLQKHWDCTLPESEGRRMFLSEENSLPGQNPIPETIHV